MATSAYRIQTKGDFLYAESTTGETYVVRAVQHGDPFGRGGKLTNDGPTMLEFYWFNGDDPDNPFAESSFTGERYLVTTLIRGGLRGLTLQGSRTTFTAPVIMRAVVWALGGNPDSPWG